MGNAMHTDRRPAACENCETPLQGAYCHGCGQHAHNPLRSFGHALEDLFESFWHLDGRVFRTLRDLFVPGRVACNYLAGQRARYIPPLRLFVILTVATFFIGQLAVAVGVGAQRAEPGEGAAAPVVNTRAPAFEQARSEAEVTVRLTRELAQLQGARDGVGRIPGARQALDTAEDEVRAQAAARIATLRAQSGATVANNRTVAAPDPAKTPPRAEGAVARQAEARSGLQQLARDATDGRLRHPARDWHEHDNPIDVPWLPGVGDRWLNRRLDNAQNNVERIDASGGVALVPLALAAVPSALFVLVPVFALLLRLMYVRGGRGYLEHLVVALYSHVFMLLALMAGFVLLLAAAGLGRQAGGPLLDAGQAVLGLVVPLYLLLMQRRVYGQRWRVTVPKYLMLGAAYFVLVMLAVVYTLFAGITSAA